jgi:hypothetical protein
VRVRFEFEFDVSVKWQTVVERDKLASKSVRGIAKYKNIIASVCERKGASEDNTHTHTSSIDGATIVKKWL